MGNDQQSSYLKAAFSAVKALPAQAGVLTPDISASPPPKPARKSRPLSLSERRGRRGRTYNANIRGHGRCNIPQKWKPFDFAPPTSALNEQEWPYVSN